MRKYLLIICLALIASLSLTEKAAAQRTVEPKFYLGAKGGATWSKMQFNPHARQAMRQGIMMGVAARYTEEKIFGIMAELLFEQRGWREGFEPGEDFSYSRCLNYITLPVLTHIYFGNERIKGFVNLGPSVSYMISSSISADFDYRNPASVAGFPMQYRSVEQMAMEVHNKFDYGILGGVGMEITVARRHSLMLEGRYYFGLGNIFHSSNKDVFSASRNNVVEVSLGYMFRLK